MAVRTGGLSGLGRALCGVWELLSKLNTGTDTQEEGCLVRMVPLCLGCSAGSSDVLVKQGWV